MDHVFRSERLPNPARAPAGTQYPERQHCLPEKGNSRYAGGNKIAHHKYAGHAQRPQATGTLRPRNLPHEARRRRCVCDRGVAHNHPLIQSLFFRLSGDNYIFLKCKYRGSLTEIIMIPYVISIRF